MWMNYLGTLLFMLAAWSIGLAVLKLSGLCGSRYRMIPYIGIPVGIPVCAVLANLMYLRIGTSMNGVRAAYAAAAMAAGVVLVKKGVEKREVAALLVQILLFSIMILPGVLHGDKYYIHRGNIYDQYFYLSEVIYMSLHKLSYGLSGSMELENAGDVIRAGFGAINSDRPTAPMLCAALTGRSWGNVFFQAYLFLQMVWSGVFGSMLLALEMIIEKLQAENRPDKISKRKHSQRSGKREEQSLEQKSGQTTQENRGSYRIYGVILPGVLALAYVWGFYGQIQYDIDAWSQLTSIGSLLAFVCIYFMLLERLQRGEPMLDVSQYICILLTGTGLFLIYPENTMIQGALLAGMSVVICLKDRKRLPWKTIGILVTIPLFILLLSLCLDAGTVKFALYQVDTSGSDVRQSWASYFDKYWLGYHAFTLTDSRLVGLVKRINLIPSLCGMFLITPDYQTVGTALAALWQLAVAAVAAGLLGIILNALVRYRRKDFFTQLAILGMPIFGVMLLGQKYWSAGKLLLYLSPYLYLLLAGPLLSALWEKGKVRYKLCRYALAAVSGLFVVCQLVFAGMRICDVIGNESCTGYLGNYPSDQAPYLKQTYAYEFDAEDYAGEDEVAVVIEDAWYQDYVKMALAYEGISCYAVPDSVFDRPEWKEVQPKLQDGDITITIEDTYLR